VAARRLTREEKQAETRDRLLRSAAKVFARHGFHGASLEQVAEEAGFTKGAVYSNFKSKEDLFVSLLEARCREGLEETRSVLQGSAPVAVRIREIGDQMAQRILHDRDWMPLFIEFWAWSVREPRLKRGFAAIWEEMRRGLSRLIEEQARSLGIRLPLPSDQLASAAMALTDGLALQMLAEPARVRPEVIGASLALFSGLLGADRIPLGTAPVSGARKQRALPAEEGGS
jgi:AcrR family transcriptional regulator